MDLEQVVLSGIFENPLEVDPNLDNYPIKYSDWAIIRQPIVDYIANKPQDDPLNNSERDESQNPQRVAPAQTSQTEPQ